MTSRLLLFISCIIICTLVIDACQNSHSNDTLPETVSYNFDIRPILSDKCFTCHGPDGNKRKAGLRLDIADSAFRPLKETKGAFAFVPGKPEQSEVYKRISSTDPTYQMPIPESHLGLLSEHQIALVKKWIEQGAKYERHWAFTPPVKKPLPKIDDKEWVKNQIDYFTLSKMKEKGLTPNEEADKERLLKRVTEDLTGLPPSIQAMDDFLNDKSDNAYEKAIDRLL